MEEAGTPAQPEGLNRRDMLRRSALVGGSLIWTAPAVQTLASPAFADSSPAPGNGPCELTFFVKYDIPGIGPKGFNPGGFAGSDAKCPIEQAGCGPNPAITFVPTLVASTDGGPSAATIKFNGTAIGSVSASQLSGNCVTIDFNMSGDCSIDESSSFFVFKDGGGPACEADESGELNDLPSAVGAPGSTVNAGADSYTFCGGSEQQGGLSHINLCVCVQCADGVL